MYTANIYNIQSFSISDGPGIRTVVFFQGCNLNCSWCHNPESIPNTAPVGKIEERCIQCGNCSKQYSPENCYAGALVQSSRVMTPLELWEILVKDHIYFAKSGGGVTFSGGECMLQYQFLADIITICREHGVHTAIDTAGHVPYDWFKQVKPDLFLYDIKASSPNLHKKLTGVNGELIWDNLRKLKRDNRPVHVRIPCVKDGNWIELSDIADRLKRLDVNEAELLEYHSFGLGKDKWYGQHRRRYTHATKEEMEYARTLFA